MCSPCVDWPVTQGLHTPRSVNTSIHRPVDTRAAHRRKMSTLLFTGQSTQGLHTRGRCQHLYSPASRHKGCTQEEDVNTSIHRPVDTRAAHTRKMSTLLFTGQSTQGLHTRGRCQHFYSPASRHKGCTQEEDVNTSIHRPVDTRAAHTRKMSTPLFTGQSTQGLHTGGRCQHLYSPASLHKGCTQEEDVNTSIHRPVDTRAAHARKMSTPLFTGQSTQGLHTGGICQHLYSPASRHKGCTQEEYVNTSIHRPVDTRAAHTRKMSTPLFTGQSTQGLHTGGRCQHFYPPASRHKGCTHEEDINTSIHRPVDTRAAHRRKMSTLLLTGQSTQELHTRGRCQHLYSPANRHKGCTHEEDVNTSIHRPVDTRAAHTRKMSTPLFTGQSTQGLHTGGRCQHFYSPASRHKGCTHEEDVNTSIHRPVDTRAAHTRKMSTPLFTGQSTQGLHTGGRCQHFYSPASRHKGCTHEEDVNTSIHRPVDTRAAHRRKMSTLLFTGQSTQGLHTRGRCQHLYSPASRHKGCTHEEDVNTSIHRPVDTRAAHRRKMSTLLFTGQSTQGLHTRGRCQHLYSPASRHKGCTQEEDVNTSIHRPVDTRAAHTRKMSTLLFTGQSTQGLHTRGRCQHFYSPASRHKGCTQEEDVNTSIHRPVDTRAAHTRKMSTPLFTGQSTQGLHTGGRCQHLYSPASLHKGCTQEEDVNTSIHRPVDTRAAHTRKMSTPLFTGQSTQGLHTRGRCQHLYSPASRHKGCTHEEDVNTSIHRPVDTRAAHRRKMSTPLFTGQSTQWLHTRGRCQHLYSPASRHRAAHARKMSTPLFTGQSTQGLHTGGRCQHLYSPASRPNGCTQEEDVNTSIHQPVDTGLHTRGRCQHLYSPASRHKGCTQEEYVNTSIHRPVDTRAAHRRNMSTPLFTGQSTKGLHTRGRCRTPSTRLV